MFGSTYAVSWSGTNGCRCAGRLEIEGRGARYEALVRALAMSPGG